MRLVVCVKCVVGKGGWLLSKKARVRWGGANSCTIRVLSAAEWKSASPECLAALFTRPFLVQVCWRVNAAAAFALPVRTLTLARFLPAQGLDDTIVDPGRFRREHLLSLGSQSTVKISSLGGEWNDYATQKDDVQCHILKSNCAAVLWYAILRCAATWHAGFVLWTTVLAEVSADGSRQLPSIGNLSHWTVAGPAALRAARTSGVKGPNDTGDESNNRHPGVKTQAQMRPLENMETGTSDDASDLAIPHDIEAAMALVKEIGYLPGTLGEHIARMRSESEASSAEVCSSIALEIRFIVSTFPVLHNCLCESFNCFFCADDHDDLNGSLSSLSLSVQLVQSVCTVGSIVCFRYRTARGTPHRTA